MRNKIVRPPALVVGGLGVLPRFYSFYSFFFARYPPSSLNGIQRKPAICSEVSAIKNARPQSRVSFPLKIWGQTPFCDDSPLNGKFKFFGKKHMTCIDNRQVRWKLQGFHASSQNIMNFGPQTA